MLCCHQGMLHHKFSLEPSRLTLSQGKVYDVTGNKMYAPGNSYNGESKK